MNTFNQDFDNELEIALEGGQMTAGVVRVGETVRRPLMGEYSFRHELLRLLEEKQYPYSPRLLGIDAKGRECLSYIEGEVGLGETYPSRDLMLVVGGMLVGLHDVTAGSDLAGEEEVVCHGDIAPWNTVFVDGMPVGLIDFDAATPGSRLDDLGYAAWTFLNIGSHEDDGLMLEGLQGLLEGYGREDRYGLSDAILKQQQKVLVWRRKMAVESEDVNLRQFSLERVSLIERQIEWVEQHGRMLEEG